MRNSNKSKPTPYESWPIWVRIVTDPISKPNSLSSYILSTIVLVIGSIAISVYDPEDSRYCLFILLIQAVQLYGIEWVEKNSNWAQRNMQNRKYRWIWIAIIIVVVLSIAGSIWLKLK